MKTSSDSMMAKVKNAVKPSQGACKFCCACKVNSPSDGDEDGRPKPRKSSEASADTPPVTAKGSTVRVDTMALGRTWRMMMTKSVTPSALAARTYSKLRARRNSARTSPTRPIQPNSTISPTISQKFIVQTAEMMMMM